MRLNRATPFLTYALIAANLIMFAVEFLTGALHNTAMLITLGAQHVYLITLGEWWRFITATFLHGGIEHLLFNLLALYIWGRYAEAMFGRVRFALVYLLSGITGSMLSYAMSASISVGASGSIFGLFGSFLFLRVYNKEVFNRIFGIQVIILIAFNLVNGFFQPNIDLWGHFGGLVGGFATAAACGLYGNRRLTPSRILAAVLLIVVFGAITWYGYTKYTALLMTLY